MLFAVCVLLAVLGVHGVPPEGESEVTFSATLTHHETVASSQVVIYDRVLENVGSGYDASTGIFTCPQSGLYVFQVHALSRSDQEMWIELRHNYNYVVTVYGHNENDYAAAGNTAIIQLAKGDKVDVISSSGYTSHLYGAPEEVYCTFSGYLISPVFQDIPQIGK